MNTNLTEIAYLLDRSGSMSSMVEPAIAGFNQFLRDQREAPGQARLTLVLFDDEYLPFKFLFLAANQDAIATAARMGIDPKFSGTVNNSKQGVYSSASSMSRKTRALRHHAATGEKLADFDAPMEEIVREEEDKDEGSK